MEVRDINEPEDRTGDYSARKWVKNYAIPMAAWQGRQEPVSERLSLLFQWQFQLRWDQTRCINYCKG